MYGTDIMSIVWWIVGGVGILALLIIIYRSFFTVGQQTAAIVMRFGKVSKIAFEGINTKAFFDYVIAIVDLRQQQMDLKVETKTKDNIFVDVVVSVQYNVDRSKVQEAYFKLEHPAKQMVSYITNSVRAQVPQMTLTDFFEKKKQIAEDVKEDLEEKFKEFGYQVHTALVTDISPDEAVKKSLNAIAVSENNRAAATNNAEADYILKFRAAQADKESKRLQGEGMAEMRKAIVEGVAESVTGFTGKIPGVQAKDVLSMTLMIQQLDTVKEVGINSKKNVIFLSADPASVQEGGKSILQQFAAGNEAQDDFVPKHEARDDNQPEKTDFTKF